MSALQSYKGMNELGFHVTLLLSKYLNPKSLQFCIPINVSENMKISQTIHSKQMSANNFWSYFLKEINIKQLRDKSLTKPISFIKILKQWKKLKDMPKSTVATFQNGLFYSKKLVKVTDEEKSDSDTSLMKDQIKIDS